MEATFWRRLITRFVDEILKQPVDHVLGLVQVQNLCVPVVLLEPRHDVRARQPQCRQCRECRVCCFVAQVHNEDGKLQNTSDVLHRPRNLPLLLRVTEPVDKAKRARQRA